MSEDRRDADHREGWAELETGRPGTRWLRSLLMMGGAMASLFVLGMVWVTVACACSTLEGSWRAGIKSDLRQLDGKQQIYFSRQNAYSDDVADLAFTNSDNVHLRIVAAEGGWTAQASHPGLDFDLGCAIYRGDVGWPLNTPGGQRPETAGEVVCDWDR